MKINSRIGLLGFLLALAAIKPSTATNAPVVASNTRQVTIEDRLTKITESLRDRESQIEEIPQLYAGRTGWANGDDVKWGNVGRTGWADGHNGGAWANTGRSGWADGHNDNGWANVGRGSWGDGNNNNNWRNSWGDGGGRFYNYHDYN